MKTIQLVGPGASYIRVSGFRQEVQRQKDSIASFEERHGVRILPSNRFEDDMPRDMASSRPDFQRMLKLAQSGSIKWIVVDSIDRFGFADEWDLVHYIGELRRYGCKLYDTTGDEWTGRGLLSFFKAGLAGHASHAEVVEKSRRVLGGMASYAKKGEWQGAPPKLGFDVACFDVATGAELFRVYWEGRDSTGTVMRKGKMRPAYHIRRRKVYADGKVERMDGNVVFRTLPDTQVMRIVPTNDQAKLDAARGLFTRYARECITFFDLAKWLNSLGIRNSFGNRFQARDVSKILTDPAYLGSPTFNKRRNGKYNRHDGNDVVSVEPEQARKDRDNPPDAIIRSTLYGFEPIVDQTTWNAVQAKLGARDRTAPAPKNAGLYLSGLIHCAGCGKPMVGRADRLEYYCSTWDHCRTRGALAESPCERNGVKHSLLEEYIGKYLESIQVRLDLLHSSQEAPTGKLEVQEHDVWGEFQAGFGRLVNFLAQHHPDEYSTIVEQVNDQANADADAVGNGVPCKAGTVARIPGIDGAHKRARASTNPPPPDEFVGRCLELYRERFDPTSGNAEIARLERELADLVEKWADLPKIPRVRQVAEERMATVSARIDALKMEQVDYSAVVEGSMRELFDLRRAIVDARQAMADENGAAGLRRRADAIRSVLARIDADCVATGTRSCGPGNARSRLIGLTFVPIMGNPVPFRVESANGGCRSHANPCDRLHPFFRIRFAIGTP